MQTIKKEKLEFIKHKLDADTISKNKNGNYIVRYSFFYTNRQSAEGKSLLVKSVYPNCTIITYGEKWKPFKGGASVKDQSHFYVEFKM